MGLKNKNKMKPKVQLTRKQIRKEKRKEKKVKRNDYYTKKSKNVVPVDSSVQPKNRNKPKEKLTKKILVNSQTLVKPPGTNKVLRTEELHQKEKKEQKKILKDMSKQRKDQLLKANAMEDQTIRKMEKLLKLNKRKTKAIPKSFSEDGLDYLLEICDPEYTKNAVSKEQELHDVNNEFEEDFALMTGKKGAGKVKTSQQSLKDKSQIKKEFLNADKNINDETSESESEDSGDDLSYESSDLDSENESKSSKNKNINFKSRKNNNLDGGSSGTESENDDTISSSNSEDLDKKNVPSKSVKRKNNSQYQISVPEKRTKLEDNEQLDNSKIEDECDELEEECESKTDKSQLEEKKSEIWEDIYGRLRSKDGSVINNSQEKYIPPAIRAQMQRSGTDDKKRKENLDRLKKQLKGLLNRLAESNMHSIAGQIETLYMNNSRNDMNETLNSLFNESLVSTVLTPERLLMEHVLLIAVLHANVGTEVGAHFLHNIIKKFDYLCKNTQNVEDKSLDNIVNILAQLYNFKVFDAKLLYEILDELASNFEEKNVECILHILRNVGFSLRKDDPIALKNLILKMQKQAASASEGKISNSRVKFLLDIILAIKNNNVTKIPNYDTTYSEHLKKIMKGFVRKGNHVTTLNITLEDLLKADERGKWWVVGSAWTGNIVVDTEKKEEATKSSAFSQNLLDLAKKQRMNTDTRRDIFCIIMSAEDYLDAFEKLLRLSLKNQQEREIIHVILHCCLQEKEYNPYYAVLAQKFCEYDRKYQMTIKYSVWDKLKALNNHSGDQISNLAKLLSRLFIEKGLPISTLKIPRKIPSILMYHLSIFNCLFRSYKQMKMDILGTLTAVSAKTIVEFSELDKITLRFMRQILLGILLHDDMEAVQDVFMKVAQSDKLKMFRDSLRLFIHHFLLKNLKGDTVPEDQKKTLEDRAKMVEKILVAKDTKFKL